MLNFKHNAHRIYIKAVSIILVFIFILTTNNGYGLEHSRSTLRVSLEKDYGRAIAILLARAISKELKSLKKSRDLFDKREPLADLVDRVLEKLPKPIDIEGHGIMVTKNPNDIYITRLNCNGVVDITIRIEINSGEVLDLEGVDTKYANELFFEDTPESKPNEIETTEVIIDPHPVIVKKNLWRKWVLTPSAILLFTVVPTIFNSAADNKVEQTATAPVEGSSPVQIVGVNLKGDVVGPFGRWENGTRSETTANGNVTYTLIVPDIKEFPNAWGSYGFDFSEPWDLTQAKMKIRARAIPHNSGHPVSIKINVRDLLLGLAEQYDVFATQTIVLKNEWQDIEIDFKKLHLPELRPNQQIDLTQVLHFAFEFVRTELGNQAGDKIEISQVSFIGVKPSVTPLEKVVLNVIQDYSLNKPKGQVYLYDRPGIYQVQDKSVMQRQVDLQLREMENDITFVSAYIDQRFKKLLEKKKMIPFIHDMNRVKAVFPSLKQSMLKRLSSEDEGNDEALVVAFYEVLDMRSSSPRSIKRQVYELIRNVLAAFNHYSPFLITLASIDEIEDALNNSLFPKIDLMGGVQLVLTPLVSPDGIDYGRHIVLIDEAAKLSPADMVTIKQIIDVLDRPAVWVKKIRAGGYEIMSTLSLQDMPDFQGRFSQPLWFSL